MANYSLVVNSRFKPFSFQEMLAPWQIYGQAYKELEDAYSTLGLQAGVTEAMLNKELDENPYNMYNEYMQNLKNYSDILATQGLNSSLRKSLLDMKTRYSKEIVPIQKAAERREKLVEEQKKLGPGYMFEYDASTTGLDKFMNNPAFSPKQINIAEIRQRSAAEFGTLAKQLRSFKENPNMYRKGFDNTVLAEYGYSPEDAARVAESIRNGSISPEDAAAAAIYNSIYNSTNIDSWSNNLSEGQQAVRDAIAEGVVGAIGQMTPQIVTDKKAYDNFKYQQELESYKKKAEQEFESYKKKMDYQYALKNRNDGNELPTNTPPIFRYGATNFNITKNQAKLKNDVDAYMAALKYFDTYPEKFEKLAAIASKGYLRDKFNGLQQKDYKYFANIKKLSKSLGTIWKNSDIDDSLFSFSVSTDNDGKKTFHANDEVGHMLYDLATMYKPVHYNVSEKGMQNIMRGVRTNVMASVRTVRNKDVVDLLKTLYDESVSKKSVEDLNWDKSELFVLGDQEYVIFHDDKEQIYKLMPGATGDFSENSIHEKISNYYTNRNYEDFFTTLTDYMADVYGLYNTQHQGQSGTTSAINDIPSISTVNNNSSLYDDGFDYEGK